jgi:drug/metabolite transporter (DMT)-like permease
MAMLLAAATLWGLSIPAMKALGVEQALLLPSLGTVASSLGSLCIRFGGAALILAALARKSPFSITALEWREGGIIGLITAVSMLLQVDGLNYTSASTAGFLIALYCVLVPALACGLGMRSWSPPLIGSCLLILIGLAALTGLSFRNLSLGRGEWESLGAACLFSVQILRIGRLKPGTYDPFGTTLVLCVTVSAACLLALAVFPGGIAGLWKIHASPRAALLTAALSAAGTAFPFFAMNRWQPLVDPVPAGFLYCFEPLASVIGAAFLPGLLVRDALAYPNESPALRVILGGALVIAANLLLLLDPETRRAQ